MSEERHRHLLTRRGFFRAGAAAGVATAAIGVLAGCSHTADEDSAEPLEIDEGSATSVLDNWQEADLDLENTNTWSIAVGNVLHVAEGDYIPVTTAGDSASPMVKGSVLSAQSGELVTLLDAPYGTTDENNTVIFDTRCSDALYAWIELNLLDHSWSLYAQRFSDGSLTGTVTTLWQADSNYDPPLFAVSGSKVIWLVMPSTSGDKTTEHSYCYVWQQGDSSASAAVESPGRFATEPAVSGDTVTLAPRVRADQGTYYGITCYSLSDNLSSVEDQLVLPQSVKPFRAVRIGSRFAFSIEANYDSGGQLGRMGYYFGTSDGQLITVSREPSADMCGKDNRFICKSNASYFLVDTDAQTYSVISAANRSMDYGEYPARLGECDQFVTFSTVKDPNTGAPTSVTVRTFALG